MGLSGIQVASRIGAADGEPPPIRMHYIPLGGGAQPGLCSRIRREGGLLTRAGIAGGRRSEILVRGRAEEFLEDRLQRVRPDLVCPDGGMQFVRVDRKSTRL